MAARPSTLIVVRSSPRLLSLLAALALFAAACGGGDTDTEAATESSASTDDSSDTAADSDEADDTDGADTDAGDDADAGSDAEATTESDAGSDADAASWPHTFVADQIGGGQLDANDLAGQDLVLWFWAPW